MADILKEFNPDIIVNPDRNNNFLEYEPKTNNYDCIIINPPFTNNNDKRYYLDFLFHSLYILNKSTVQYFKQLCIICPDITKSKDEYFSLIDIFKFAGKNKIK